MILDLHKQPTSDILAILKQKGLKIKANACKAGEKNPAPDTLEIAEGKYSGLLSELVELREFLAAA